MLRFYFSGDLSMHLYFIFAKNVEGKYDSYQLGIAISEKNGLALLLSKK